MAITKIIRHLASGGRTACGILISKTGRFSVVMNETESVNCQRCKQTLKFTNAYLKEKGARE